eukprot:02688.XXX_73052_73273_1 [CDS] Oithona nana genome sequencing.
MLFLVSYSRVHFSYHHQKYKVFQLRLPIILDIFLSPVTYTNSVPNPSFPLTTHSKSKVTFDSSRQVRKGDPNL